jgi:hypothetical protein
MAPAWEIPALVGIAQYSFIVVTEESYQGVIAKLPITEWRQ